MNEIFTSDTGTNITKSGQQSIFKNEDDLDKVAEVVLTVGVVASIILFITIGLQPGQNTLYLEDYRSEINWHGAALSFLMMFVGVVGYFVMKTLSGMSRSITQLSNLHLNLQHSQNDGSVSASE